MKRVFGPYLQKNRLVTFLTLCILCIPILSYGQKKDITLTADCVEAIGDGSGRYVVSFGYENTNSETVAVDETNSVVTYNYGQSKKYGTSTFLPGKQEKVFTQEFTADDRVVWTVQMPNDKWKTVSADINSNHCFGVPDIIPYYTPPEGGKVDQKSLIGAELTSLYNKYDSDPADFIVESDDIFQLREAGGVPQVFIEVVSSGQLGNLLPQLTAWNFEIVLQDDNARHATGWMPITRLLDMNDLTSTLNYARPVYPGVGNYSVVQTGRTQSQGDKALRSDFSRLGYGIDGDGVKIGVISNSYNTIGAYYGPEHGGADEDIGYGDLPGPGNENYFTEVDVFLDIDPDIYGPLSDEGRAMLQIIHDIAPGAELAFRTGFLGEQDMADGIRQLANGFGNHTPCDLIVDDITYITAPFFRDGVVAKAVDEVVAQGVTFFSSAGNFGDWSYENTYTIGPGTPNTITGKAHDFGGGDIFQMVDLEEGTYTIVLQWDDGTSVDQSTTGTDMDIFLASNDGSAVLGFNRVNSGGAPVEVIPFKVNANGANTNIVISKVSGPNVDVRFKYIVFRGGDKFHIV